MARIARVVAPIFPHHITQRGNRRQKTFFCEEDCRSYKNLMAEWCNRCKVEVWAYCLMPNHVHLIAVPKSEEVLRRAIGEAHRRYTRHINFREKWQGHLWQGRFASFPMEERYLLAAARYVEMNPVRAGIVQKPEKYTWSSASAHISGRDDELVKVTHLLEMAGDWRNFLAETVAAQEMEVIRSHERTGRPLGSEQFVAKLERILERNLQRLKPGPKPKNKRS
ncbi:MAG: transposase [Nitrospirota bacterium]